MGCGAHPLLIMLTRLGLKCQTPVKVNPFKSLAWMGIIINLVRVLVLLLLVVLVTGVKQSQLLV